MYQAIDDPKLALDIVTELRDAGVEISIDGYSSGLSYLHTIPAQQLKIDKMFVRDMMNSRSDALLVKPTIDLAHSLGMKIAAEGVDTAHRYHVARTMPLDDFLKREASPPEQRATPALKGLA